MYVRYFCCAATIGMAAALAPMAEAQPLAVQAVLVDPGAAGDGFASAIALSGGRALISAQTDATTGTGSGRAYLYDTASGALLRTFDNPTPATNDQFGSAAALSGNLALIAAQHDGLGDVAAGAAYLFDTTSGALLRTFADPGPGSNIIDNFGHAVALSGDRALISAIGDDRGMSNAGAAYLFDTATGALLQTFLNPSPGNGDFFGQDVALSGNYALVSSSNDDTAALNAGAAYLFDTTTGALLHTFLNPTPELNNIFGNNDNFGFAVALSATRIAIGAPNEGVNGFHNGAVYLYDLVTDDLLKTLVIPTPFASDPEEFLGNDVALSADYLLAGAPFRNFGLPTLQRDKGGAFLFDAQTGAFLQEIDDTTPNSGVGFGFSVALDEIEAGIRGQTSAPRPNEVLVYDAATEVPEPGTLLLLAAGLTMLAAMRLAALRL